MSHCGICSNDLDGRPAAFADAATLGIDGAKFLGGDVCLPCGVTVGGSWDGILLTPWGLAEAASRLTEAMNVAAQLAEGTLTRDEFRLKYSQAEAEWERTE